jgi:hypothetical protein
MHTSGHMSFRPQSIPWIQCGRPLPLEPHDRLHRVAPQRPPPGSRADWPRQQPLGL